MTANSPVCTHNTGWSLAEVATAVSLFLATLLLIHRTPSLGREKVVWRVCMYHRYLIIGIVQTFSESPGPNIGVIRTQDMSQVLTAV